MDVLNSVGKDDTSESKGYTFSYSHLVETPSPTEVTSTLRIYEEVAGVC